MSEFVLKMQPRFPLTAVDTHAVVGKPALPSTLFKLYRSLPSELSNTRMAPSPQPAAMSLPSGENRVTKTSEGLSLEAKGKKRGLAVREGKGGSVSTEVLP